MTLPENFQNKVQEIDKANENQFMNSIILILNKMIFKKIKK